MVVSPIEKKAKQLDPGIERLLRLVLEARRTGALEQAKGVRIEVGTAPARERAVIR